MAYQFGQFRKEQYPYSNYVKQFDKNEYTLTTVEAKTDIVAGISFTDVAIKKSFTPSDGSMLVRVSARCFDRDTTITVKLAKDNVSSLSTTNIQTIAALELPKMGTAETEFITFDLIVTPSDSYAQLIFTIDRDAGDFTGHERKWVPGLEFIVQSFGTISNIIPTLDIENKGRLKQIGVQGRAGLEMCINGEMIRVGRSGIYEINHGVDITFIGFIPDESDHFLMDYQF